MATIIKDKTGACVAQSHDLRAMIRHAARFGGVVRLDVTPRTVPHFKNTIAGTVPSGTSEAADVVAHYANGFTAHTLFVSHSHAVEWAFSKSERRGTMFSGCDVRAPGAPLDEFTRAYMVAALWSSCFISGPDEGAPLDSRFDLDDIGPAWRAQAIADCRDFQRAQRADLAKAYALYAEKFGREHTPQARAGHDFWLTRNGHGAGFWDRGFKELGQRLTEAAKLCGSVDLTEFDTVAEQVAEVPEIGHTLRTACGRGRISYHPDWSQSQPWASYIDGTAGRHFATVEEAAEYFKAKRMTLNTEGA